MSKRLAATILMPCVALMLLVGCATTTVEAVYTVAPRVVHNLKALGAIRVDTEIALTGNAVQGRDALSAQMLLQEDMVSRLDQESQGGILVCDSYFAGTRGGRELAGYLTSKGRAHGYASIVPEPSRNFSTLKLQMSLAVNRLQKEYQANFQLLDMPYRLVYDPYDPRIEPDAVPMLNRQRITSHNVSYALWGIQATGTLTATLRDAQGRLIYTRTFPNLSYGFSNQAVASLPAMDLLDAMASVSGELADHDRPAFVFSGNLWPLPTTFGIIRRITYPCLSEVIRDIIPNRQRMELHVNEGGNQQMLMLLRGGAYRDALAYSDSLGTEALTAADWENRGVACECLGKLSQAKYCYETALKLLPGSEIATSALNRLGH